MEHLCEQTSCNIENTDVALAEEVKKKKKYLSNAALMIINGTG